MKKIFQFLISFLIFSGLFFALWLFLETPYTVLLGHSFSLVSRLLNLPFVTTVTEHALEISIRQTTIKIDPLYLISNMVVVMTLVMSTPLFPLRRKLPALVWSCLLLFAYHLISLYIILVAHGISQNATGVLKLIRVIFLLIYSFSEQIGKVVMPFIIWLLFTHRVIFGKLGHGALKPASSVRPGEADPERQEQDKEECFEQDA